MQPKFSNLEITAKEAIVENSEFFLHTGAVTRRTPCLPLIRTPLRLTKGLKRQSNSGKSWMKSKSHQSLFCHLDFANFSRVSGNSVAGVASFSKEKWSWKSHKCYPIIYVLGTFLAVNWFYLRNLRQKWENNQHDFRWYRSILTPTISCIDKRYGQSIYHNAKYMILLVF